MNIVSILGLSKLSWGQILRRGLFPDPCGKHMEEGFTHGLVYTPESQENVERSWEGFFFYVILVICKGIKKL